MLNKKSSFSHPFYSLPFKIYLSVGIFLFIMISAIIYSWSICTSIIKDKLPIADAIMELRLSVTYGHLEIEEYMLGESEDIEKVWKYFDNATQYANTILYGGMNKTNTILYPLDDNLSCSLIKEILSKIEHFKKIQKKRYLATIKLSGSPNANEIDKEFKSLIRISEYAEVAVRNYIDEEYIKYNFIQNTLILISFLIGVALLVLISFFMKQEAILIASLNKSEKDAISNLNWLHMVINSMGEGLIITKEDSTVTHINDIALKWLSILKEPALGSHILDIVTIVHKKSPNKNLMENILQALNLPTSETLYSDENTFLKLTNSKELPVSYSASFVNIPKENTKGIVFVFKDMTKEYKLHEQVRTSEEDLSITLSSIGDAVIATDINGNVTRMNLVAEDLTGWDFKDAKGKVLSDIFCIVNCESEKSIPNPVENVLKTGHIMGLANHTILISKKGVRRQISDSASPIRNINGGIVGVVLVFRDVSDEYIMQEQFRHGQKMKSIGKLAGGVAHDFNNMLGGIIGATELLSMKLENADDDTLKYINLIKVASERASLLTKQLLNFSRKGSITSEDIDIHTVIYNALEILNPNIDPKIELITNLDAKFHTINGDSSQLQNAIINLVLNSKDAIKESGFIKITSSNISVDKYSSKLISHDISLGEYLLVSISDNGSGMDKELQEHIFEPFFTTKEIGQGTGLGLASVYGTISEHKGAINVYSEIGKGTDFKIYIPLAKNTIIAKPLDLQEKTVKRNGLILVVDDEKVLREMVKDILEAWGYRVLIASDGVEAIDLYKSNYKEVSCVILDMVMPNKNGEETYFEMIEVNPNVKVIVSSGFSINNTIHNLLEHGCQFIQKPYNSSSLAKKLDETINPPSI